MQNNDQHQPELRRELRGAGVPDHDPARFRRAPARKARSEARSSTALRATQTIQFLSAGNPNLKAETGKSLTLGGVLTPRFIPGFSFSVDYFKIKVTNLISVLGAQTILNSVLRLSRALPTTSVN